ncbi:MGMT family protein [Dietzia sp.]|uniref:MGMT family protein n=1 Tax=Dietzia sp. TaxID=1871616 RepID=UPI002FD91A4E
MPGQDNGPGIGSYPGPDPRSATSSPWPRLELLLERLPSGYWTSYGDVAEVLGTGARAVGTRLARHGGTGAYRVLRADGSPSAGFSWSDPAERRSVREVLESEGVAFGTGGKAARERRLGPADLEDLLDLPVRPE